MDPALRKRVRADSRSSARSATPLPRLCGGVRNDGARLHRHGCEHAPLGLACSVPGRIAPLPGALASAASRPFGSAALSGSRRHRRAHLLAAGNAVSRSFAEMTRRSANELPRPSQHDRQGRPAYRGQRADLPSLGEQVRRSECRPVTPNQQVPWPRAARFPRPHWRRSMRDAVKVTPAPVRAAAAARPATLRGVRRRSGRRRHNRAAG